MTQENNLKEIEKIKNELELKKQQLKTLEIKYTPSGIYKSIAGRKNILSQIYKNNEMPDDKKYIAMVEKLKKYVESL